MSKRHRFFSQAIKIRKRSSQDVLFQCMGIKNIRKDEFEQQLRCMLFFCGF
nr:MAG TPA: hypothetical protein [Caudoviricetes sp.]